MSGWVRLYRTLADHPIWRAERFTRGQAWADLIVQASFTDHIAFQGNRAIPVKRGQVLTSQVSLAGRWKWNRETVRAFLRLLESNRMAAIETSKATDTGYTLITLLNYDLYQGGDHDAKVFPSAIESAIQPASIFPEAPEISAIDSAIDRRGAGVMNVRSCAHPELPLPPSEPASNRHPTAIPSATIKKGKKVKKHIAAAPHASAPEAEKGNSRASKTRATAPVTDDLLREFSDLFKAKFEEPYLIEWARDRKAMGGLVAVYGPASVRAKMAAFFEYGTRETRERRAYTVPEFRRVFPRLVAMQAMGDLG